MRGEQQERVALTPDATFNRYPIRDLGESARWWARGGVWDLVSLGFRVRESLEEGGEFSSRPLLVPRSHECAISQLHSEFVL